jgi:hypothetical protein
VHFEIEQSVGAPPDVVVATYADPEFYASMAAIPELGLREVLEHRGPDEQGQVEVAVRLAFTGNVSGAARKFVDPEKLTWVTRTTVRPAEHDMPFVMEPDHYQDRLTCSGNYRFESDGPDTRMVVSGDLEVHLPFVGRAAERAIADGFRRHVADEAALVVEWAVPPG